MTPGLIYTELKKELGSVNPYMAIVDASVRFLLNEADTASQPHKFISEKARSLGYGRLYLKDLALDRAQQFVYISHLAFINSKAEVACDRIRKQSLVLPPVMAVEGDYLREAVRVLHASRNGTSTIINNDIALGDFVDVEDVVVVDYYRKLRNENFHADKVKSKYPFDHAQLAAISEKYGFLPSEPGSLSSQDMVLLSMVWQNIIFKLCSNALDPIRDIMPVVSKRYKGIIGGRKERGIIQHLRQEYLLDSYAASELFSRIKAG
ncbi:hypothetical protein AA303_17805 [Pseudomonas psychrophila]|uniref:hypothetical protein n=1 Tax=Pseudomonas psychrophila TaxID=122355 RepID=UPI00062A2127|nr:hypothetical protein [Pseudomonas psychrophila]KOX63733.1 hypothetical protein AA303_17805 [Pseudomonas psychrophila]